MPTTTRLTKPAGYLPAPVVRALRAHRAGSNSSLGAKRPLGLAYIVAYALLPLVTALVAAAVVYEWGATSAPAAPPKAAGVHTPLTNFVPAHDTATGTTQARAGSDQTERPGTSDAERTGTTAAKPLSHPLGSR